MKKFKSVSETENYIKSLEDKLSEAQDALEKFGEEEFKQEQQELYKKHKKDIELLQEIKDKSWELWQSLESFEMASICENYCHTKQDSKKCPLGEVCDIGIGGRIGDIIEKYLDKKDEEREC